MFTEPPRVSGVWHTNYKLAGHLPFQTLVGPQGLIIVSENLKDSFRSAESDVFVHHVKHLNNMFGRTELWKCLSHVMLSSNAFLTISTHLPWVFSHAQQKAKPLNILKWVAACLLCTRLFVGTSESQNQCATKHFHRNLFCQSDWNCNTGDGQT